MAKEWRGINDFYFVKGNTQEQEAQPVDTEEDSATEEEESPEVKLIEGKWLPGGKGFQFNKKCIAQVKAEFLKKTSRKKVTIDTFVEFDGEEEDLCQQVEAFLDDDGIGETEVTLFYGEKYSDAIRENPDATCAYKFIAHHNTCEKDIESELLEMPQEEVDGEIFYDLAKDEIGIVKLKAMESINQEIKWMDAFTPHMKVFIPSKEGNEKDRKAEAKAVMYWLKEFADAKDDAAAQKIVDNLDDNIAKTKDEILEDEEQFNSVKASGHKMKEGDVAEFFWVTGKRMVRIRSNKIKKRNRWFNKDQVMQQIKKEHKDAKEEKQKKNGPAKELEVKLFEKKLFSEEGGWSPEIEEFNKKCNINFFEESEVFDAGIGAQFLRHSAEGAFGATLNWKEDKAIKVGGKAEGSFALAQAQGHFDINLPNENGFDLISMLKSMDDDLVDDDSGEIYLLIQLSTKGSAFIGCCASISLDLGVSVKEKKGSSTSDTSAGAEAGLDLFAGVKTGADATLGLKMKLISEEDSKNNINPKSVDWTTLADVSYGVWFAAGIGVQAGFKLGYFENRFRYQAKIGVVLKGGAGTFLKGSIDPVSGAKLIWTIADALNWKHMGKVLEDNVHDFYQGLMANCFLAGKNIQEAYYELAQNLEEIFASTAKAAEAGLGALKNVDDTFDKYIPGYSGFKQFHATFLLLKSTYQILRQINSNRDIKQATIAAVEKAEKEGLWKYATWQMKVNLIYDMRFGGSGLGGLSEERKEDAVIAILKSSRSNYEFKKVVDNLIEPPPSSGRDALDINKLLDFSQQGEYDKLKQKHNY